MTALTWVNAGFGRTYRHTDSLRNHLAKVRVAGSSPVARSDEKALITGPFQLRFHRKPRNHLLPLVQTGSFSPNMGHYQDVHQSEGRSHSARTPYNLPKSVPTLLGGLIGTLLRRGCAQNNPVLKAVSRVIKRRGEVLARLTRDKC
jgi:hypothetical protein